MRLASCSALVAFAVLASAAPARSQAPSGSGNDDVQQKTLSLTPYLGVNIPTGTLLSLAMPDTSAGADTAFSADSIKVKVSITFGGRLGIALGRRFGIQADVGYSPGTVDVAQTGATFNQDVKVLTGSAKAIFYLIPRSSPLWINVSGGLGAVRHTLSADLKAATGASDKTSIGGVVGTTAGFRLGKIVALTATVEDYLYTAEFDVVGGNSSKKQNDIRITGGIRIPFLGM